MIFKDPESLILNLKEKNIVLNESIGYVNIIAVRENKVFDNKFSDKLYWLTKDTNNNWRMKMATVTTKAGLFYVTNLLNPEGVAILKPGVYKDSHKLGLHKGLYKALVQQSPLTVFRDKDKDDWADYINPEEGIFGINIHRSNASKESVQVDKWSAACIVFSNPFVFNGFIKDCENHALNYTNNFTLILI